jgi:sensor histidine kinase YesM
VKVRLGERLTYEIESSPAVAETRMPPMMLLPLLDYALAAVLTDSRVARSLRIRAGIADGKVRLAVTDSGEGFVPAGEGESIADIRERLSALYGRDATLLLQQRDRGLTEAAFELPLEGAATLADVAATVDAPTLSASLAATRGIPGKTTVQASLDALPTLPPPSPRPREPWFTGLTWKGIGLVALVCLINGVRRNILGLWAGDTLAVFLNDTVRMTAYGLIVAAPIVLAIVATYNLAQRKPSLRYASLAVAFLLSSLAGVAAWVVTEASVECGGSLQASFQACYGEQFPMPIIGAWIKHGSLCALFAVVFVYLREADESVARAHEAESARARFVQRMEEARLRMLQAQIEPHFLFNALANVRRLYQTDPAEAATMLDNLMRYFEVALPQMRAVDTTLGREAELTESYLGIQKIRMGRRLAFDITIPAPLRDARLPPMMLLTLAENAIKHGLAPLPEGGTLNVSAAAKDGELQVRVSDSGRGFTKSSGGGTGLANIRARLSGMYGSSGRLTLSANALGGIVAIIAVPLSTAPVAGAE